MLSLYVTVYVGRVLKYHLKTYSPTRPCVSAAAEGLDRVNAKLDAVDKTVDPMIHSPLTECHTPPHPYVSAAAEGLDRMQAKLEAVDKTMDPMICSLVTVHPLPSPVFRHDRHL